MSRTIKITVENLGFKFVSPEEGFDFTFPFNIAIWRHKNANKLDISSNAERAQSKIVIDFNKFTSVTFAGVSVLNAENLQLLLESVIIAINAEIITGSGAISARNPLSTYQTNIVTQEEIDYDTSDSTGWVGDIRSLFDGSGVMYNDSISNPKQLKIDFLVAIQSFQLALSTNSGSFSNLKISATYGTQAGEVIYDKSTDNTDLPFSLIEIDDLVGFGGLLFEFYTTDRIDLTAISIAKYTSTISVIRGEGAPGTYKNVFVNGFGRLGIDLAKDIFSRLQTANPETVSDNSLVSEHSNTIFWSEKLIGTATVVYNKATSSNTLSVTNNGDIAIKQLKLRGHYQPAKAQEYLTTGLFTQETGVIKRVGYFDVDNYDSPTIDGTIYNGVLLKVTETDISFEVWNNGVLDDAASMNGVDYVETWNIDLMDGEGGSGITLDMNFPQIGIGEIEWLGVGAKRVGFNIGGINIPVHLFEHANIKGDGVYMRTAKLPICYMIESVSGAGSMRQICNSIISGGGQNAKGVQRGVEVTSDIAITNGQIELGVGIRLKAEDFDTTVIQESLSIVSRARNDFTAYLCINPIYTGTVTWNDLSDSSVQWAENNNNTVTNLGINTLIQKVSGNINSVAPELNPALRIGKGINVANEFDELWIVIYADDGNDDFSPALNFRELL